MGALFEAEARTKHRISPGIIAGEYQVRYGYRILQLADDGVEIEGKGHRVAIVKQPNFLAGDIFAITLLDSGSGFFTDIMGSKFINQHKKIIGTIDMMLDHIIEYYHEHLDDFPEFQRDSDFEILSYEGFCRMNELVLKDRNMSDRPDTEDEEDDRQENGKKSTKGQLIAILVGCGIVGIIAFTFHALLGVAILAFSGIAGYALSTGYYIR